MEKTKTQVPEAVPSVDEQLAQLQKCLAGSHAFADCRGLFGYPLNHIFNTAPAQLKKRLGSIRVMTELVQKLQRLQWKAALYELQTTLNSEYYTYAGEVLAEEKTVPVTLVMYEPEKTLALLDWLFSHPLSELNRFIEVAGSRNQGEPSETTRKLFQMFPSLEASSRKRFNQDQEEGQELWLAHKMEVLDMFNILRRGIPMGLGFQYHKPMIATMENVRGNSGMSHPFAFLVRGRDQRGVFESYPRTAQDLMATWQFHLPVIYRQIDTNRFLIGLHKEQEHAKWSKRYPAFASRGVVHGKGALVVPPESSEEFREEYVDDPRNYLRNSRIILSQSGSSEWPWNDDWEKEN